MNAEQTKKDEASEEAKTSSPAEEASASVQEENTENSVSENDPVDESIVSPESEKTAEESSEDTAGEEKDQGESSEKSQDSDSKSSDKGDSYQDKYLRLHAEFENYRRRTARETLEIIETANSSLLEKLTEVADNFDRAFSEEHKSDDLETFRKGMTLIHEQFNKVLKESGLEEINPVGEAFDPNVQEAFLQQPSDEVNEGCVISVFQKGYKVKNKVIRTAKVIVSSGPEN